MGVGAARARSQTPGIWLHIYSAHLDTLYTCEAANPKNMDFGLQSVLRHSARDSEPTVDYTTSINLMYTRLTVYLLEESNSLHLLALAVQQHFRGYTLLGPRFLPYFHTNLQRPIRPTKPPSCPFRNTQLLLIRRPNAVPCWAFKRDNRSFLLVRGTLFKWVVEEHELTRTKSTFNEGERTAPIFNVKAIRIVCPTPYS